VIQARHRRSDDVWLINHECCRTRSVLIGIKEVTHFTGWAESSTDNINAKIGKIKDQTISILVHQICKLTSHENAGALSRSITTLVIIEILSYL